MKKLLIWGPAPWGDSGYSRVIGNLGPRLAKKFDVSYFAYTHAIATNGIDFHGGPVYTVPFEYPANMRRHFVVDIDRQEKPDIVLQIFDIFTAYPYITMPEYKPLCEKLVSYSPVDSVPLGELIKKSITPARKVVAMTHFGKEVYEQAGIKVEDVIYHGVDNKIYPPLIDDPKETVCDKYKLPPDCFLVLMVQDNRRRKNLPAQIRAFQEFKRITGANAHLLGVIPKMMEHCEWNLDELWRELRTGYDDCGECFTHISEIPQDELAELYFAADVLLQCPFGEGFGLPIIEAGACFTPTIGTDFSSIRELIGYGRGYQVHGELNYCQPGTNTWQMTPAMHDITLNLAEAYTDKKGRDIRGDRMAHFVAENCNWDKLAERFSTILDNV